MGNNKEVNGVYIVKKVHEKEEIIKGKSSIVLENNDFCGINGCIKLSIITDTCFCDMNKIAIKLDNDEDLYKLLSLFKKHNKERKSIKIYPYANNFNIYTINNIKQENGYLLEIEKKFVSSSSRSKCRAFIELTEKDINKLRSILLRIIGRNN